VLHGQAPFFIQTYIEKEETNATYLAHPTIDARGCSRAFASGLSAFINSRMGVRAEGTASPMRVELERALCIAAHRPCASPVNQRVVIHRPKDCGWNGRTRAYNRPAGQRSRNSPQPDHIAPLGDVVITVILCQNSLAVSSFGRRAPPPAVRRVPLNVTSLVCSAPCRARGHSPYVGGKDPVGGSSTSTFDPAAAAHFCCHKPRMIAAFRHRSRPARAGSHSPEIVPNGAEAHGGPLAP